MAGKSGLILMFGAGLALLLLSGDRPLPTDARVPQDSSQTGLLEAVRRADLKRSCELLLDDQDGAERLFLRILEDTIGTAASEPGKAVRLEHARRLADVFFLIYEFDFERGIVSWWEKEPPSRKRELLAILRDHYAAYRDSRSMSRRLPQPFDKQKRLLTTCLSLADRYREMSFGKGELQAMLWACSMTSYHAWKTWQLAKNLRDEVGEAWGAYYFGKWAGEGLAEFAAQHAVEAAERLRLPKLLHFALIRQAWRALGRDDFDAHVGHLRGGLEAVRTIPVRQTMAGRSGRDFYPGEAWLLKTLWRAYELKGTPGGRTFFEQGRILSRRHGGEIGELAYLIASMQEFARPGLFEDIAARAEALARKIAVPGWTAAFLITKAGGLSGTRKFQEAFVALDEAASIYERMGDRGHLAECLIHRASFRSQTNDLEGTRADYREAIRILDALDLAEDAVAVRIRAGLTLQSRPKLALGFLNEGLAGAEALGSIGLIRNAYSVRARILSESSPDRSLDDYKKELFYAERYRAEIGYPGEVPVAMRIVSQALRRQGWYGEALEMEKRRAAFARAEDLPHAEADAYYWLSIIYGRDLGEPAPADEFAAKYVRLMSQPGKKLKVNDWDKIAGAYHSIGQPGRALEFWRKALQLAKETPAGEHFQRMLHINIARACLDLGDYDAAISELGDEQPLIDRTFQAYQEPLGRPGYELEDYYATISEIAAQDNQAQRRFLSSEDPIEIQRAEWFAKSALSYALSGNMARAAEESRRAIALEFSTPLGTVPADYESYFTPGDALALAGELGEAMEFHENRRIRARDIGFLQAEREALIKLGSTRERAGNLGEARKAYLEAVRIDRRPPGPQVGNLAESLSALGSLELRAGNWSRAEDLFLEARKTANPYELNQSWRIERSLAAVSAARGKKDLAERHFELALSALEGGRERLRPEEFALRFGIDRLRVYDEYASFLAGRAIETGAERDAEKALMVVERRRAQALWDLMALGWAGLPPDVVPEQMRRARQAEARIAAKLGILRDQFSLPPEKRNDVLISTLESDLKEAKEEHARLLTVLAQGKFRFTSPSPVPPALIAEARKKLRPDRILLEYLVTDAEAYAFVLSSTGLTVSRLPANRQELRRDIQGLVQPYYRLPSGEADLSRLGFDFSTAYRLYTRLVAPIEPRLAGASRIMIVPDDALHYLPIELLVDGLPGVKISGDALFAECEQAGFLVRRLTMSYLTSAAQFLDGPGSSGSATSAPTLLAMANPTARKDSGETGREDPVRRRLRSAGFGETLAPLPGSAEEVARIRRFFPAGRATVLTGAGASEASYKALSPRSGIIHFATHAIAADDHPFYSTLVLAPGSKDGEDGFLQAYEILRCPVEARLVVMSACETARGPVSRGEGLVGLVSAFFQAGARSVLATQWSIDESAADLMASFYRVLTGGGEAASALRAAKLDLLKKRLKFAGTEVSLAHPFFWAPFVLIGSGD